MPHLEKPSHEAAQVRQDIARLIAEVDALSHERLKLQAEITTLEKRAQQAETSASIMGHCAELINAGLSLNELLTRIMNSAVEFMHAERGFIALRQSSHQLDVCMFHHFDRQEYEAEAHISRSIVERVLSTGKALLTTDAQGIPVVLPPADYTAQPLRSIICVPLRVRATTIGVMYLDALIDAERSSMSDPALLLAFANLAAPTIENARLIAVERIRAREIRSLETLQTRILETIAGGVITIDEHDRIFIMNEAAERSLNLKPGALLGHSLAELERYIPGLSALVRQARCTGSKLRQTINTRAGNHGFQVFELQVALVATHNTVVVFHDLSAQQHIQDALSRYLAPHVVRSLLRNPAELRLGGERQRATILFADICGFTQRSARMKPEDVVTLLNRYLEQAIDVIFAHDGLLDKFYGDGLMAVFGPPRSRNDDAERALTAALALLTASQTLSLELEEPIQLSIGIASGTVVAGHIGSSQRMDYTVIGDAVNLASRLEASAEPGSILCDEATFEASGLDLPATPFVTSIRGRDEPFTIYRIQ